MCMCIWATTAIKKLALILRRDRKPLKKCIIIVFFWTTPLGRHELLSGIWDFRITNSWAVKKKFGKTLWSVFISTLKVTGKYWNREFLFEPNKIEKHMLKRVRRTIFETRTENSLVSFKYLLIKSIILKLFWTLIPYRIL